MQTNTLQVMDALHHLMAAGYPGDLVSLPLLRAQLALSKGAFDAAVLSLCESDQVSLHLHDLPASLSRTDREALVVHPDGTYFCAISPRRRRPARALLS